MAESLLGVKKRIQSVESIRKITKVMKLIASSRYTYFRNLYDGNLSYLTSLEKSMEICLLYADYGNNRKPTCMRKNQGNKKLYIFVTCTLGLCGAYVYNLEKLAKKEITKDSDCVFIGEKGYTHFKNSCNHAYTEYIHLLDNLTYENVNSFRHYLDHLYKTNNYSEVILISTKYENSFSVVAKKEKLFPLEPKVHTGSELKESVEPIFGSEPTRVADLIVPHYLDAYLYHSLVEACLSEHTSRKNSMENATSSAEDLISELKLRYNKLRQSKITQEITEVISGSESN